VGAGSVSNASAAKMPEVVESRLCFGLCLHSAAQLKCVGRCFPILVGQLAGSPQQLIRASCRGQLPQEPGNILRKSVILIMKATRGITLPFDHTLFLAPQLSIRIITPSMTQPQFHPRNLAFLLSPCLLGDSSPRYPPDIPLQYVPLIKKPCPRPELVRK